MMCVVPITAHNYITTPTSRNNNNIGGSQTKPCPVVFNVNQPWTDVNVGADFNVVWSTNHDGGFSMMLAPFAEESNLENLNAQSPSVVFAASYPEGDPDGKVTLFLCVSHLPSAHQHTSVFQCTSK